MWEDLSGGFRAGLTLERCSRLAVFAIQPVGWYAAAVWLVQDGAHLVYLFRTPIWCPSEGGGTREVAGPVTGNLFEPTDYTMPGENHYLFMVLHGIWYALQSSAGSYYTVDYGPLILVF